MLQFQRRRGTFPQHGPVVSPIMTNRGIERREKPLMRRRKDNDTPAWSKMRRCGAQLVTVALDMFKNVNIDDCVKASPGFEVLNRAADELIFFGILGILQIANELSAQLRIGLETDPLSTINSAIEKQRISSNASTNFQNIARDKRPELSGPVRFPIARSREEFQLGANIFEVTHENRCPPPLPQTMSNPEEEQSPGSPCWKAQRM